VNDLSLKIQELVRAEQYRFSAHAERERHADQITIEEFEQAFSKDIEIIEDYPDDPRGASCLAIGFALSNQPIHVVYGLTIPNLLVVVTIYRPSATKWHSDWRTRR
jgi:Domain of unknown function (DUF4258)